MIVFNVYHTLRVNDTFRFQRSIKLLKFNPCNDSIRTRVRSYDVRVGYLCHWFAAMHASYVFVHHISQRLVDVFGKHVIFCTTIFVNDSECVVWIFRQGTVVQVPFCIPAINVLGKLGIRKNGSNAQHPQGFHL